MAVGPQLGRHEHLQSGAGRNALQPHYSSLAASLLPSRKQVRPPVCRCTPRQMQAVQGRPAQQLRCAPAAGRQPPGGRGASWQRAGCRGGCSGPARQQLCLSGEPAGAELSSQLGRLQPLLSACVLSSAVCPAAPEHKGCGPHASGPDAEAIGQHGAVLQQWVAMHGSLSASDASAAIANCLACSMEPSCIAKQTQCE